MFKKGDIVLTRMHWGKEPTPERVCFVNRVAKDGSWADIESKYGRKRMPNPSENLKKIDEPIVVHI